MCKIINFVIDNGLGIYTDHFRKNCLMKHNNGQMGALYMTSLLIMQ